MAWGAFEFVGWFKQNRPFLTVAYEGGTATFQFAGETFQTACDCDEAGAVAADTEARGWVLGAAQGVKADTYPQRQAIKAWLADDEGGGKAAWLKGS